MKKIICAALLIVITCFPSCSSGENSKISPDRLSFFSKKSITVNSGETYCDLLLSIKSADGSITPESLVFISEDTGIAEISLGSVLSDTHIYCNIEGVSEGNTVIYVKSKDGNLTSETIEVKVLPSESDSSLSNSSDFIGLTDSAKTDAAVYESTSPNIRWSDETEEPISLPDTSDNETSKITASGGSISLVSISSNVKRGDKASVAIKGKPNVEYSIKVYYSSSVSKAKGLENKTSDSSGMVNWEWRVGNSTKPGSHKIMISGGEDSIELYFNTTE